MKGDNQHFEVNTWLVRTIQWVCAVMYWESVRSRDRVKSFITTTSPWMQRLQNASNVFTKMKNTQAYVHLYRSYVNHMLHWHDVPEHLVGRWVLKKNALQICMRVSSITGKFPFSINHRRFANAHKGNQGSESQMQPRLCQRSPPDVLC